MKKRQNQIKLTIIIIGIILIALLFYRSKEKKEYHSFSEDYVLTDEIPEMMAFTYYPKEEWEKKMKEASFPARLTYGQLQWILQETGTTAYVTYQEDKEKKIVQRSVWNDIYGQLLDLLDTDSKVSIVNEAVLSIENENMLVTGAGKIKSYLPKGFLKEQEAYSLYKMDSEVIGIYGIAKGEALLENVLVTEQSDAEVKFLYEMTSYSLPISVGESSVTNHVCDIVWTDGALSAVRMKSDTIAGNLVALNDDTIEIEGYGQIKRSLHLPVYKTYGTVEEKELSDIVIANMKVQYVVAQDRVEAILLVQPAELKNIRVLLLGDDGGVYRSDVRITSDLPFSISYGEENIPQTQQTVISVQELMASGAAGCIRFLPQEGGTLYFCNEKGEKISLDYCGNFEVRSYPEGLAVVNEVPIEEYLCSVVPSEMPSSYELEALKAQAVCARSYAYIQLLEGAYAAYGAHIDDSTNYQVYNKQERSDSTTKAVLDTAGLVLNYQGNVAEAYYFSTSAGVTGNGECWGLDTSEAYGYLKTYSLDESNPQLDLSSEDAFNLFITNQEKKGYDSTMPYYRWTAQCRFDTTEIQDKIKTVLAERKIRVPGNIIYLSADLSAEIESMEGFGALTDITVESRSTCGIITKLLLHYENGCVRVMNEYNMRLLLGIGCSSLTLADGSQKDKITLLPSAYLNFQKVEGGSYHVTGGGYGHGIGMSQNGAQGMAQSGKTFDQILGLFFNSIEITTAPW